MPSHHHLAPNRLLSRRAVLIDLGGLFAGALVVVGCSSSSSDATGQTSGGDPSTATTSAPPSATTSAPTEPSVTSSEPASADGRWQRVDMGFVSAYIVVRAGEAIVVDTGPSGNETALEAVLTELGVGWGDVADVILTHRHPDHVGSLGAIADLAPQATFSTGAGDVEAIGADLGLRGLGDGDIVNGLEVIATPGHTAGHISMLDRNARVLLAGDAINGEGGGVTGPNPDFTPDMQTANASVQRLVGFDYQTILFGHGEPVAAEGSVLVGALAETLR